MANPLNEILAPHPLLLTFVSFLMIVISWVSYLEALRSTQPRVPERERNGPERYNISDVLRVVAFLLRSLTILLGIGEVWALFVSAALSWDQTQGQETEWGRIIFNSLWMKDVCPTGVDISGKYEVTSKFYPGGYLTSLAAVGLFVQAFGGCLRIWSQRTLGRFFTWELTILRTSEMGSSSSSSKTDTGIKAGVGEGQGEKVTNAGVEHKLITSGPYAFVRHPGYLGAIFLGSGQLLFGLSSSTFLNECVRFSPYTVLAAPWRVLELAWLAVFVSSIGLIVSRVRKEDGMLRQEFGKEWDVWASGTRWKLVPFVY